MSISEANAKPHDPDLLDRLADLPVSGFEGIVWRATRLNHDPVAFSYNGGRWAPPSSYQSVPALYTSFERDGAIAEMASWLSLLTPMPTKPILIHKLSVKAKKVVTLNRALLPTLGIDLSKFLDRSYAAMGQSPPSRSQEIGAALSFLGIDGLIAPSVRSSCDNLVIFDNLYNDIDIEIETSQEVNWTTFVQE